MIKMAENKLIKPILETIKETKNQSIKQLSAKLDLERPFVKGAISILEELEYISILNLGNRYVINIGESGESYLKNGLNE